MLPNGGFRCPGDEACQTALDSGRLRRAASRSVGVTKSVVLPTLPPPLNVQSVVAQPDFNSLLFLYVARW